MSGGYMVRFMGGPAHDIVREVEELLRTLRIPVYNCPPDLGQSEANPYVPGEAVYTLIRTPDGGGIYQYRNDEGTTEMTEHLHYIAHTHDTGYGIETRFTCTGGRTSPCHLYPPDDAEVETWGEADRGMFVPHDDCWMKSWMEDAGCAETCGPDGEHVRSGPITVTWNGDCLEWEYAKEATA